MTLGCEEIHERAVCLRVCVFMCVFMFEVASLSYREVLHEEFTATDKEVYIRVSVCACEEDERSDRREGKKRKERRKYSVGATTLAKTA